MQPLLEPDKVAKPASDENVWLSTPVDTDYKFLARVSPRYIKYIFLDIPHVDGVGLSVARM